MLTEIMKAIGVKVTADLIQRHAAQLPQARRRFRMWRYGDQIGELMCLLREGGVPAYGDDADIDDEVQSIGLELNRRGGFGAMQFVA